MDLSKNNAPEDSKVYKKDQTLTEHFLKTEGRLNRLRYFKRNVVLFIVGMLISILIFAIFGDDMDNLSSTGDTLFSIIGVGMLIPSYCLNVRRLHDMNKSNELAKFVFVFGFAMIFIDDDKVFNPSTTLIIMSLVYLLILLYITFGPGTKGSNEYGADPLA